MKGERVDRLKEAEGEGKVLNRNEKKHTKRPWRPVSATRDLRNEKKKKNNVGRYDLALTKDLVH